MDIVRQFIENVFKLKWVNYSQYAAIF